MSAPPGFNDQASMLPAAGGTIQPMKGGAAAIDPSLLQPTFATRRAPVPGTPIPIISAVPATAASAPITPINVKKLVRFLIDTLLAKKASISNGKIVVDTSITTPQPESPEQAHFLEVLNGLNPTAIANLSSQNITFKMISPTDVELTIKIPNTTSGGTRTTKQLKRFKTLKASKKSQGAALPNKKIHHKEHKNPAADEEEDICLTLVR